jgi:hypothetical protein
MPLYYFDTDVGGDRLHDEEGLDLPDAAAARDAAMGALPDMARDELGSGDRVRDASGTVVYSATLDLTGEWHVPQTVT